MKEGYFANRDNPRKRRPTRYYSKKQEKAVAKSVKGKVTLNSGATAFKKGDVENQFFLIECKTKTQEVKSVSIYKHWLEKNVEEAFAMNKQYSALAFDFGDGKNYYVLDERAFQAFNELLSDEQE